MLAGALIIFGCAVFDILDSMFWAYDLVLAQYGFFVFTMGITLILANRFISIHKILESNLEMSRIELEIATEMHSQLLSPAPSDIEGWEIALSFKPKHGASGDFYDFYVSENRLEGISLFDVSGHGVSAALITMIIKPIIFRLFGRMKDRGLDEIINRLDQQVSREIESLDNFASCILLRFKDDAVEYVNAAHPDMLHLRCGTGAVEITGAGEGLFHFAPIGQDLSHNAPGVINVNVDGGDLLLLFTDCILESRNVRTGPYGMARLMKALSGAIGLSARETLDCILKDFYSYVTASQIADDFTVICLKKKIPDV
jgi:sigma-B regulation protein RsbU (phosphoserine phosphatase)